MIRKLISILAAGSALLFAVTSLNGQGTGNSVLFGVTLFGNQLITIDPTTGSAVAVGTLSSEAVNGYGIAARAGKLYTFNPNKNVISQVNPINGTIFRDIAIGITGLKGEGDLAFRSDGIGFLASALDKNGLPTNDLYTFDIDKGTSRSALEAQGSQ